MKKYSRFVRSVAVLCCVIGVMSLSNNAFAMIVVNTNTSSVKALKLLNETNKKLNSVFTRLSSGLRINAAADDAAGLGVAESKDLDFQAVRQAIRITNDGISVIQTAEGAANQIGALLKRMRELATQASSEVLSDSDAEELSTEFDQLKDDVDRVSVRDPLEEDDISRAVLSPAVQKMKDSFFDLLQAVDDKIQDTYIENTDYADELAVSPVEQINASIQSLNSAFTELTVSTSNFIKGTNKIALSAELKIKKLEQQRQKALKSKQKPGPKK